MKLHKLMRVKVRRLIGLGWTLLLAVSTTCYAADPKADRKFYEATVHDAERGDAMAQCALGACLESGHGVVKDLPEAVQWYRRAADQGDAMGQCALGVCYEKGRGVDRDAAEAAKWYGRSAAQGFARAQLNLGACYANGLGVKRDDLQAHKWYSRAAANGEAAAAKALAGLEHQMTKAQIAEAKRLAAEPPAVTNGVASARDTAVPSGQLRFPKAIGAGFFLTEDGFLVTAEAVIRGASEIRILTQQGAVAARVIKVDAVAGLALLKLEGRFRCLPVATSRSVRVGTKIATVGFSGGEVDEFTPKVSRGEVTAPAGTPDDLRYFGVRLGVEPGGTGGAVVDERGNVVGVVAPRAQSATPEGGPPLSGRWAIKSSLLLSFLESVPEASVRLPGPNTQSQRFDELLESAKKASGFVLVFRAE